MNLKNKRAATISVLIFLLPFFLLLTILQYFLYYLQTFVSWFRNKCVRLYNYIGSPWYPKKDKRGVYYHGPIIIQIYTLIVYLYEQYLND